MSTRNLTDPSREEPSREAWEVGHADLGLEGRLLTSSDLETEPPPEDGGLRHVMLDATDLDGMRGVPDEASEDAQSLSLDLVTQVLEHGEKLTPEEVSVLLDEARLAGAPASTLDLFSSALEGFEEDAPSAPTAPVTPSIRRPYVFLPEAEEGLERRATKRLPLALPAKVRPLQGKPRDAEIASGSVGGLFVRCRPPPPHGTSLIVDICLLGNHRKRLPGTVVRATDHGFALQIESNPSHLPFQAAFLELARQPSLQSPVLSIEIVAPPPELPKTVVDANRRKEDVLGEAWRRVVDDPVNEDINQTFIHTCMREQDLDYAVDRYRERLAAGDPQAERYLEQVGTIIGFYSMGPRDDIPLEADGWATGRIRGAVAIVLALLMAFVGARFLYGRQEQPVEEISPPGPTRQQPFPKMEHF